jgi:hypothetical protein
MHSGLPVAEHGLYEWNVFEPALGRVITPLRFSFAGDQEPDTLLGAGIEAADLLPGGPTFYERLAAAGAPSFVFQPAAFSPSTFDGAALRGAEQHPYDDLREAVAGAAAALDRIEPGRGGYAYVYYDRIDATGHRNGPSSAEFAAASARALDAVHAGLTGAAGLTVLLTADHGQLDVDADRTLWLDELHPPLAALPLRPAGSARDVFLHVPEPEVEATLAALAPHAEVHRVAELVAAGAFGRPAGPRLLDRLATVCVLPPPGRMAWLGSALDMQQGFRGHHGGRTPDESRTWLGELRR